MVNTIILLPVIN